MRILSNKAMLLGKERIHSIVAIPEIKGFLIIEARSIQDVGELIYGTKNIRKIIPGALKLEGLEKFFIKKPIVTELKVGEEVEIMYGPFKGMAARIEGINVEKSEVTVLLLGASYPLPLTMEADYVRPKKA